jgi:UDP-N-acetylmuramate--alanine ligase
LGLPGRHNLANSLAVAALAYEAGLDAGEICVGLETFGGVGRRLTLKGKPGGVVIVDDYAHHPTEIRATLAAVREKYVPGRLWCVFQPHQASRTSYLLEEFAGSFGDADIVLLADIYSVRDSEAARREVSSGDLARRSQVCGVDARYLGDFARIVEVLCQEVMPGDVVVTMGAGNVGSVADELLCRLGTDS